MAKYFTIHTRQTTYLCEEKEDGILLLAFKSDSRDHWILYTKKAYWFLDKNRCKLRNRNLMELPQTEQTKEWVAAVLLMGKHEGSI